MKVVIQTNSKQVRSLHLCKAVSWLGCIASALIIALMINLMKSHWCFRLLSCDRTSPLSTQARSQVSTLRSAHAHFSALLVGNGHSWNAPPWVQTTKLNLDNTNIEPKCTWFYCFPSICRWLRGLNLTAALIREVLFLLPLFGEIFRFSTPYNGLYYSPVDLDWNV